MNITVYLGSARGSDPKYAREVIKLGTWIGENGNRLIYGGSRIGLMGDGTGTLEEISEVMSQIRLGHNDKTCIIFNLDGYYDPLRIMLDSMVREGFLDHDSRRRFLFVQDVDEIDGIVGQGQ